MPSQKVLELRKLKRTNSYLGDYETAAGKKFRAFSSGKIIISKDGKTQYLVQKDGSFKRL